MAWGDVVEPRTLRECRIVLGQSQAAFAAMLGVSPESYRTWDAGRRATPPHVMARARALATHRDEHALLPLPRPSAAGLAHGVHGRRARRGYSGVGLYSKLQPIRVDTSLGVPRFDREGRFMAGHFQTARGRFVVVNGYFPKGSGPDRDNSRVGYKLDFSRTVFARAQALRRRGPVLVIGDYNTAHHLIDLARPQANVTHSGFLPEERAELDRWIDAGWVDAFRALHPEEPGQYTWWRQWGGARERNIGWRIDHVFASPAAMRHIHEALTPLSRQRARRRRSDRRTNKQSRDCAVSTTCVRALRDRRRTSRPRVALGTHRGRSSAIRRRPGAKDSTPSAPATPTSSG